MAKNTIEYWHTTPPKSSFTGDFTTWSRNQSLVKERYQTIPICSHERPETIRTEKLANTWPVDIVKPSLNNRSLHLKPRNLQGFTSSRIKRSTSSTWPFNADISAVETWLTHCENLKGSPSTPREISLVTSADEMSLLVNRSLLLSGWMTPAY
jgi:hypothetical protein